MTQAGSPLAATFTNEFKMNNLISKEYETLPLQAGRIPGYAGNTPGGGTDVVGQRRAAASLHTIQLADKLAASGGTWADMNLVDLRPEQRSYNKHYMYAENIKTSTFLKFPSDKQFDHRKL